MKNTEVVGMVDVMEFVVVHSEEAPFTARGLLKLIKDGKAEIHTRCGEAKLIDASEDGLLIEVEGTNEELSGEWVNSEFWRDIKIRRKFKRAYIVKMSTLKKVFGCYHIELFPIDFYCEETKTPVGTKYWEDLYADFVRLGDLL